MNKLRVILALATIAGGQTSAFAPAHAAIGLAFTPGTMALAATGLPSRCESVAQPAFGPALGNAATVDPGSMSKSQAILGGQVSKLDLIMRQQAGSPVEALAATPAPLPGAELAAAAPLPGATLAPSAGGADCQRFVLPQPTALAFQPGLRTMPLATDDFLASKRLPVKRTAFDAAWNRVRRSGVSRRFAAALVRDMPGPASSATLQAVNSWTNAHVRYVEDSAEFGKADFWAEANRTLRRREGDCEDIAIAKMQLLAALGIAQSDMYLTIARDLVRNSDHALLVVSLEGRNWLLDNATNEVLDASQSYDYRPILSFSGSNKWLHGYQTAALTAR